LASIIGDSHFSNCHGATALGWMTLQGKKSAGTDMHSKTAQIVGISRDHSQVMNYGRIYGAGQTFAARMLQEFNPKLSDGEAKDKAQAIYSSTKGIKKYVLNENGKALAKNLDLDPEKEYSIREIRLMIKDSDCEVMPEWRDLIAHHVWTGGSESAMFNSLEAIARSSNPVTPFLNARISRALEPERVGESFMTSRVNWVVQSSAVDFLHLMLVSMRWLFDTYKVNGRFSISIHDEVHYLVQSKDRYRAALALHMTNLYVRSFCAYQLGMNDLPQSVAFFSSVEIDRTLRKEASDDCITPSNPHGLKRSYGIERGESMDIFKTIDKTKGSL